MRGLHDVASPGHGEHVTMRHSRGSMEGGEASLVEGTVGGCLALGCSLGLDTTSLTVAATAATARHAAATAGPTAAWAADTAVLATELVV